MSGKSSEPILQVNRLSYRYPEANWALQDISFTIAQGESLGLVGPSGAGKSTLLMHLNGLLPERVSSASDRSNSVTVRVGDYDLVKENLYEIRRLVGFLFQNPDDQLFCATVQEDVAFGPLNLGLSRDEVLDRVTESLTRVDLNGYEQRSTLQLSIGEQKRVCLAGILACQPSILALDEPFSNLDPKARRSLMGILCAFPGTQIVATHELELVAEFCDRVLLIDDGKIQADGPCVEVLSNESLLQRHGLEVPLGIRRGLTSGTSPSGDDG